jgi:poly-gamma-glutamate capsule biosynthesis protein CapA/YwtB (metallophosphatase superfamily)
VSGPVPHGVAPDYIWGDALAEWERMAPHARVVNLETSITHSDEYEQRGINYRMHPDNIGCLRAAQFDICILANNHVLDYGPRGLIETLTTLERAGIRAVGAGRNRAEAVRPVVHALAGSSHRLVIGACAHESSGVPDHWAALMEQPGVHLLPDLDQQTAADVATRVARHKSPGDIAILSIHCGSNWGYDVPRRHIDFAHRLVEGGIDIVHGHSSHHVRPVEIYHDRLILYGCGDFINDYEGISGYARYRNDLVLMFFPSLCPETGRLLALEMTPLQIRHLRLNRASTRDARWICDTVNEISRAFNSQMILTEHGTLRWHQHHARA